MALDDASYLAQLKEARDKLTQAIIDDVATVQVTIRGRTVQYADPTAALERINKLIDAQEQKVSDQTRSRISVGTLNRASTRG